MPKFIDLTGQFFDSWKVVSKIVPSKNGKIYWQCECQNCFSKKEIQGTHLRNHTYALCSCQKEKKEIFTQTLPQKQCLICGKFFTPKNKAYTRKYCYECSPSYSKTDLKAKGKTISAIRHSIKHQLILYKGGKCQICGYDKCEGALHFHHKDSDQKEFEISKKYNNGYFDMQKLKQEVDKCQLLCANCHAEKHFQQL